MSSSLAPYFQVFNNRRIGVMILLGFASGLPLALTSGTLQAWMTVEGIDLKTIGIFSMVGLPYTLKFLWSPFMDRFVMPFLGRRRCWIITCQTVLIAGIIVLGSLSPQQALWLMALISVGIAFTSASQDIVVDAYRTDLLHEKERGAGAAVFVMGYRIGMLVSGALALIMSDQIGWHTTYMVMAAVLGIGVIATLIGPEPEKPGTPPGNIQEAVVGPFRDFLSRPRAFLMLLAIILYKLGDAYAGTLTTAFLIRGVGFTPTDVGTVNKGLGLKALVVGAIYGGSLMVRLGLLRALLVFGLLQAISNLSFMVLAWTGKSYGMMVFAVGFENLSGGMGTSAFVAFLMALCNHRFSATQYALLSSLAALGRTVVSPTAGFLVESTGWPFFFFITTLTALPGLMLMLFMRSDISKLDII